MSQKNVLFLSSWFPSRENETLGNFVQKHASCSSEIAELTVLYASSSESVNHITFEESHENGYKILRVYYPKLNSKLPVISAFQKVKEYKSALWEGFKKLDQNFDLVHLNVAFPAGLFALELKQKLGLKYVILSHWTGYLSHTNTYKDLPFYLKRIHRRIFSEAYKTLVVSEHLGESLKALKLINEYTVYPNVVEKEYFYPPSTQEENSTLQILHVSSFDDTHKNVSGMLRAISKLKRNYHLHLISESNIEEVKQQLDRVNIRAEQVTIQSKCTPFEVGEAMRKSNVLVLFSNYETFSVVIAEAWMCGLPVIYSKCGGLTEIKDVDLGIQITKKDESELYKSLENFNPTNYSANKISQFANKFEKLHLSDEIMKIYDQMC